MNKVEAEAILIAATGGQKPNEGDTLVWTGKGWKFAPPAPAEVPAE